MEKIILGIDPGTLIMGFAVLKDDKGKLTPLLLENLDLRKVNDEFLKLKKIFEKTSSLVKEYKPDQMVVEAPFLGKNVQSMLKLGRIQGVVISACMAREIPITQYMPKKIKLAVTGNGNASKEQVCGMVKNILNIKTNLNNLDAFDAFDAMAVALCYQINQGKPKIEKEYSNWSSFINSNKNRIK